MDVVSSSYVSSRSRLLDAVAAADVPFVRHSIAGRSVAFVNEPQLIKRILVTQADCFEKSEFQMRVMGVAEGSRTGLGQGLLTSSNAMHRRQHKLIGRLFSSQRVQDYGRQIAAITESFRERWLREGEVDLADGFMDLSLQAIAKTMFSWEMGPEDEDLVESVSMLVNVLGRGARERRAGWHDPTQVEAAAALIESRLMGLVDARRGRVREPGDEGYDLIDLLLTTQASDSAAASHGEGDYVVTDRQIRDELMTMFITGAENPRNALTWTVYLLARHPQSLEKACELLRGSPVEREAGELYVLQVFKETLRLYPPGYAFGRRAVVDVEAGPLRLAAGTEVVVSPYALHRRPELFADPLVFEPSRFEPAREKERPPYSYLPFGAGARSCIGGGFAMMQGQIVLSQLLRDIDFELSSPAEVRAEPRMTLRPSGSVRVRVARAGVFMMNDLVNDSRLADDISAQPEGPTSGAKGVLLSGVTGFVG